MLLYQNANGYCYNSDTLLLYDFILQFKPKGRVLDVGSGCGILGLLLKRDFDIELIQIDIQKENCFLNTQNARVNALDSTIICDDFLNYEFKEKFDLIISNPPYYSKDLIQSKNTHINVSRYNQHLPIELFFKKVNSILKNHGKFIFCYDSGQICDIIYFSKLYKLRVETLEFVYENGDKNSLLVLVQIKKGSFSKTKILPPLIRALKLKKIYQKARTYSIKCTIS